MSERRYFNLGPVVRDLEHGSGPDATAEGRDLWARFCDCVWEAYSVAAALDADDGTEDEDEPDDIDGDVVGHGESTDGRLDASRPGRDAASRDDLLSRLARLEAALAAQPGPESAVPSGTAAVDGTGRGASVAGTIITKKRLVGPRTTSEERVVHGPSTTRKKKRTRKKAAR